MDGDDSRDVCFEICTLLCIPASAPSSSAAQATPPPWIQEQQKPLIKELIHQLHQTRQREQVLLTQGSNGEEELEVEFSNVVKPVMESCTKDSISVSMCLWVDPLNVGLRESCLIPV